jgi:hypothetical protein
LITLSLSLSLSLDFPLSLSLSFHSFVLLLSPAQILVMVNVIDDNAVPF